MYHKTYHIYTSSDQPVSGRFGATLKGEAIGKDTCKADSGAGVPTSRYGDWVFIMNCMRPSVLCTHTYLESDR